MARKPHSTSLVLLLVCIFALWWGVAVLTGQSAPTGSMPVSTTAGAPAPALGAVPIAITESKNGDIYTFSGSYTSLNPCDYLGSGIRYSGENGGSVTILLTTAASPAACAQAAGGGTGQTFSVSVRHPGGQPQFAGALLNGTPLEASLAIH